MHLIGPPIRVSQKLSFQSQERFSKIQEQISLFETPKRFEDMNVKSSVRVTQLGPSDGRSDHRTPMCTVHVQVCNFLKS